MEGGHVLHDCLPGIIGEWHDAGFLLSCTDAAPVQCLKGGSDQLHRYQIQSFWGVCTVHVMHHCTYN